MYVALQNTGGTTLVPAGMQLYSAEPGLQKQNIITLQSGAGTQYFTTTNGQQLVASSPMIAAGNGQGFIQGQRFVQLQPASIEQGANGVQLVRVAGQPQQLQQVRMVNATMPQGSGPRTLMLAQSNGPSMAIRPATVMQTAPTSSLIRPAAGGTQATLFAGAPPALRPLVARVPRLGTVQTYNPATGTVMQPASAAPSATMPARPQGPMTMAPAGLNQPQMVRVQAGMGRPDVGGRILQAANTQQQQQQFLMHSAPSGQPQQQLLSLRQPVTVVNNMQLQQGQGSAPRGTTMVVGGAGNGPVQLVRVANGQLMYANGQQLVQAQLVDQQQLVARLVEAQATQLRNTVLKVPVSAGQGMQQVSNSGGGGMPDVRATNLRLQQQLEQQQQQQLAGNMVSGGSDGSAGPISMPLLHAMESGSYLMDTRGGSGMRSLDASHTQQGVPLSADLYALSGSGLGRMPLARGISAPLTGTNGSSVTGHSSHPSSHEDTLSMSTGNASNSGRSADTPHPPGSAAGGKGLGLAGEDLQHILASIGVELARHGIPVDAAVSAGWLGVLSARDVALLGEVYAEEEGRMAAEAAAAANNAGSGGMVIGGARDSHGGGSLSGLSNAPITGLHSSTNPSHGLGPAGIAHTLSVGSNEDERSVSVPTSNNSPPPSTAPGGLTLRGLGGLTAEQLSQLQGTGALGGGSSGASMAGDYSALHLPSFIGDSAGMRVLGGLDGLTVEGGSEHSGKVGNAPAPAPEAHLADRFANLDLGCGFF